MTWNHRVIRQFILDAQDDEHPYWYQIHEVYYDKKDGGEDYDNVIGWTRDAIGLAAETPDELRETLERISRAIEKPMLDLHVLEQFAKARIMKEMKNDPDTLYRRMQDT